MRVEKDLVISITIFTLLLVAYIILSIQGNPNTNFIGELLKYVIVSIISYFLGRARESYARALHWKPEYGYRVGLVGIGFGFALILSHAILYGIDLIDPLGHEWIGLYAIIASMLLIAISKQQSKTTT